MTSPYALIGAKLCDAGYHAIPVLPGSKRPGIYLFQRWRGTSDWTRYCDRLPTEIEIDHWEQWPDAGVCVAIDHRLKVIDIDTDEPALMAAVIDTLPDSPVKKRGRKGFSAFYQGSAEIQSAPFSVARSAIETVRVLDLLAYDRQTVLPPTVHADTDAPYEWLTDDTLVDTPLEQLPELPADVAQRLGEALKPFGYTPQTAPLRRGDGDSYWRDLNSTALLNLDCWVPALNLPKTQRSRGGYRAVAEWRGVENANLSFNVGGIRDWGEDKSYTPIDVVVAALRCDVGQAAAWLEQQLGIADTFDVGAFIERARHKGAAEAA